MTLTSRTYDDLGNVTSNQHSAFVDRTPPRLTVRFAETPRYVSSSRPISVEASDPAEVAKLELYANGRLVRTDTSIRNSGTGVVDLAWDPTVAEGFAVLSVRAYDTLGNVAKYTRSVIVDNTRPAVTVAPASGAHVRGTLAVSATNVREATGLTYLAGYLGDWQPGAFTREAPWTVRLNSREVADGKYTLTCDVMDRAGNITTIRQPLYVDNTAPAVAYRNTPANNAKLTKTVTLTASASDRFGAAKVQMLVNGAVVATDSTAAYSFALNPKNYGKTFTVQLRAYDRAGNATYTTKRTYHR